jgi:hypothetical protein
MNAVQLRGFTKKRLIDLARREGLTGWKDMNKDQLLNALIRPAVKGKKPAPPPKPPAKAPDKPKLQRAAARDTSSNGAALADKLADRSGILGSKDLSAKSPAAQANGTGRDRIVVMVRDPYWLHVYWELTHHSIQRAEAALGQDWHGAKPILRLLDVSSYETTSTSEAVVRDIDIHGGCNNWYVDVKEPPKSYRIDIGYLSRRGEFKCVARSNVVTTPKAGASDAIDENWADLDAKSAERFFAMSTGYDPTHAPSSLELKELFEERLRRPMSAPALAGVGPASHGDKSKKFWFQLDAELIVYGATEPNSKVTLQGEPVKLRPDGTFTMRFSLPDGRQIIPAVANSGDGVEERTIVLAIERNTKQLEPMVHDPNDG